MDPRDTTLALTSSKSNIGHLEGSARVSGQERLAAIFFGKKWHAEAGIAGFLKCVPSLLPREVRRLHVLSIQVGMLMAGTCPPNAHLYSPPSWMVAPVHGPKLLRPGSIRILTSKRSHASSTRRHFSILDALASFPWVHHFRTHAADCSVEAEACVLCVSAESLRTHLRAHLLLRPCLLP